MTSARRLVCSGFFALAALVTLACGRAPSALSGVTTPPVAARSVGDSPGLPCALFPADNIWNARVDGLPVHPQSADFIDSIGRDETFHADFGSGVWPPDDGGPIGIPFVVVPGDQPQVEVAFEYEDESDPGPYPIPPNPPIEGGPDSDGDRHILIVDAANCVLYELYAAYPQPDGSWQAGSGAIFDLNSNDLRPDGWTSADAAGLPILPGLVRYDEVAGGTINHALRFTAPRTQRAAIWPARHFASDDADPSLPPMGLRLRLRPDYDLTAVDLQAAVILLAMQQYGIILADNGSPWYISGVPDSRWDNDNLRQLARLRGDDFEVVDVSRLMAEPDSGRVRQLGQRSFLPSVARGR